jgi:hypothetical protein
MPLKFNASFARNALLAIWLGFFVLDLVITFSLYLSDKIGPDNFWAMIQQLNSLYVTYLGAILIFFFTSGPPPKNFQPRVRAPVILALVCSFFWNFLICIFLLRLLLEVGTIEDSRAQIGLFGPLLSWFVAPVIGFYFARQTRGDS